MHPKLHALFPFFFLMSGGGGAAIFGLQTENQAARKNSYCVLTTEGYLCGPSLMQTTLVDRAGIRREWLP